MKEINPYILLTALIVLFVLTIYLLYILNIKKANGKRLSTSLKDLNSELENNTSKNELVKKQMEKLNKEKSYLYELDKNEKHLQKSKVLLNTEIVSLENKIENTIKLKDTNEEILLNIKNQLSIYQPIIDLANLGFFEEPDYLFDTSDRYKEEIKAIRAEQKERIINNLAIMVPTSIAMTDNQVYVKRVLSGQAKLMLKAFNVECDALVGLVKPSNYAKVLERINKAATDLEKSSVALKCSFRLEYIDLKYKECELQYHYKLKHEEERDEQARIREQIREEQKAIKEYERAISAAEKEESLYRKALEKAKGELSKANEYQKAEFEGKIAMLEMQLKEAEEKGQRAKSLAEQTRKGHVYVISNIGSFGENIYKIGLTRRLEPIDRVKELSGASVPFPFDVHAMIYSEDAPALEARLHKDFSYMRVNKINRRKEFFKVDLNEVKDKVIEITGSDENFKMTAAAENYYESLKLSSTN